MEGLKRLPVSTQEFTVVREDNLVYLDKTDLVWQLSNAPENVTFFSRPRRFGKTMLISTLEAYFQGRSELFEGLKIMELEKEWKKYEVLRFDLSGSVTADNFNEQLARQLMLYEQKYGIENTFEFNGNRFSHLIQIASQGERKVVCLFDEYDYPLQHTLFHEEEEHEVLKKVYRDFFAVLKAQSRYIKFVFITGITKFTGLSLFSVLNNIKNISFRPEYQSICGITTDELRGALLPYVEALAQANGMDSEEALGEIKNRYDGYHFFARQSCIADDCKEWQEIYNPYCLINALNDKEFCDYWVSSGNTQMLMDAVDEIGWDGEDFENIMVPKSDLETSDVSADNLALFLYQSGYLTIKALDGDMYTLGIPNTETRNAVYKSILPRLTEKSKYQVDCSIVGIKKSFAKNDIPGVFDYLRALVAETPYSRDKSVSAVEEKFQFILKNSLFLCNCRMVEEQHISTGRIDLVAEHRNCILVMELKMTARGGTAAAERQTANRNYAAAYAMRKLPIYTVAIEFNGETRQMGEVTVGRV